VADVVLLGVFVGDDLVKPVAQPIIFPSLADLGAVYPGHQIGIEDPGINIDLIPDHAAAVSFMWDESAPPASMVWVGTTDLMVRDAQLHHPLGGNVVHRFGIPLGEVPGVHHRIIPQGPLRWRRADDRWSAEQPLRRSLQSLPPMPDAHA